MVDEIESHGLCLRVESNIYTRMEIGCVKRRENRFALKPAIRCFSRANLSATQFARTRDSRCKTGNCYLSSLLALVCVRDYEAFCWQCFSRLALFEVVFGVI